MIDDMFRWEEECQEVDEPQQPEQQDMPFDPHMYPVIMPSAAEQAIYGISQAMQALTMLIPMAMMSSMAGGAFLQRMWISPEDYDRLTHEYSVWAVNKALQSVPPAQGVAAVEAAAKKSWLEYSRTMGYPPPKEVKTRKAKEVKEPKKPAKKPDELTQDDIDYIVMVINLHHDETGNWPRPGYIVEVAAEHRNKTITEPMADELIDKVMKS